MAIAASIMLWCATPQQAAADTYEKHEIASVQQQKVKTTGTVLDQNGEAMIGVSVKVKDNATMGTITDLEGKFSIDAPKGATLEISYIGYKTVTVKAEGTALHITMKEDAEVLDEVVIVGYGSQKEGERNRCCRYGKLRSTRSPSGTKCITGIAGCSTGSEPLGG